MPIAHHLAAHALLAAASAEGPALPSHCMADMVKLSLADQKRNLTAEAEHGFKLQLWMQHSQRQSEIQPGYRSYAWSCQRAGSSNPCGDNISK